MRNPSPDPRARWSRTSAARKLYTTRTKSGAELLPLRAPAARCGSASSAPTLRGNSGMREHDLPPELCRERTIRPGNKLSDLPTSNSFCPSHLHGSQCLFQEVERCIEAGFHCRHRTRKNLRHLLELESLIDLQQHSFTLVVRQPTQSAPHGQGQLNRKHPPARFAAGLRVDRQLTFRTILAQQRISLVVRNAEQPARKLRRVFQLLQVLIGL